MKSAAAQTGNVVHVEATELVGADPVRSARDEFSSGFRFRVVVIFPELQGANVTVFRPGQNICGPQGSCFGEGRCAGGNITRFGNQPEASATICFLAGETDDQ